MAKIVGIHQLELKPGGTEQQADEMAARLTREFSIPGLTTRVAKGDRGPQSGRYIMILEIDSKDRRDRYFPLNGEDSAEFYQHVAPYAELIEQVMAVFVWPDPNFNDYVVSE